ncbi:contractile injection system tape measure protein [Nitrospirillum iridis]|uniref:Uncharacterized protein n=1 Tax=Nitrospirillum iridis TaxID=765888 RepID=A0A7X0AV87_9PROT|nr:contractile injection system tape measure protein [Nitrospirillum iridis]MBB6250759.1 hypothetical protein [Nitrospirillum iridis]
MAIDAVHRLRRLALDVSVPDLETAQDLRARVDRLAQDLVPPVLARIIAAVAPADRTVVLDRLDLDLGVLAPERLEEDALAALERALTEALVPLLARHPAAGPSSPPGMASRQAADLELADIYLTDGVYPFWGDTDATPPSVLLATLATEQPLALGLLLRRRLGDRAALQRLVLHLAPPALRRLLDAMAPADAAVIAAWMADVGYLHQQTPLPPRPPADLGALLWLLTLEFLARDAGTQFNRRSYLRTLLSGLAEREGVEFRALLALMGQAVRRVSRHHPLGGSLTAVLAELLAEEGRRPADGKTPGLGGASISASTPPDWADRGPGGGDLAALARRAVAFLRGGGSPADGAALATLAHRHPAELARLLRDHQTDGAAPSLTCDLFAWLAPEELAHILMPDRGGDVARWVAGGGAQGQDAATALLAALVDGRPLPPVPTAEPLWSALDRLAALRDWLDGDDTPDTTPDGDTLAQVLADLPLNALLALFQAIDTATVVRRLRRVVAALPVRATRQLLLRLAPQVLAADTTLPGGGGRSPAGSPLDGGTLARIASLLNGQPAEGDTVPPPPPAAHPPTGLTVPTATVLAWLAGRDEGGDPAAADFAQTLTRLIEAGDADLDTVLAEGLSREEVRVRWAVHLPDRLLARLLSRLEPSLAGLLLQATQVLGVSWPQTCPAAARGATGGVGARRPWALLLRALAAAPAGHRSPRAIVDVMVRGLVEEDSTAAAQLLARARFLAAEGGRAGLAALLRPPPPSVPSRPVEARPSAGQARSTSGGEKASANMPLHIHNAGLVLFNPFLPQFMERLGVVTEGPDGRKRVSGVEPSTRAVHLLQYLVDGRLDRPEPDLVLNKLLCGLDPAAPVGPTLDATPDDLALCDGLLGAVIAHWPIIKNSSVAALRETFLQREGRLERETDRWALLVQRKTVDVLVDQVPWSYATLYHKWMGEPLHVTW